MHQRSDEVLIPDSLARRRDMPAGAKLLWALVAFLAHKTGEPRDTVAATYAELAEGLGRSPRAVRNLTGKLEALGLLTVEARRGYSIFTVHGELPPYEQPERPCR